MRNARLDEAEAGIKIARRNVNNLRYVDDITLMAENEDHGIWSHHLKANRWGNNGKSETFIFLGSKITADGDCSHEIKRWLLLGRKAMINLDSIL